MKILVVAATIGFWLSAPTAAEPQTAVQVVQPGKEAWVAGQGIYNGAWLARLGGDPAKSGPYVLRLRMPAGFLLRPHTHNVTEFATVISGTVAFGFGDRIDSKKETVLQTGAFVQIPAGAAHYWVAKTEAVLQSSGNGPRITHFLIPKNVIMKIQK